jgi:hypothetical protein
MASDSLTKKKSSLKYALKMSLISFGHRTSHNLLLHSGSMNRCWQNMLVELAWAIVAALVICGYAGASESGDLQLDLNQQVIYCAVEWQGDRESLSQALQAGIGVTFAWQVQVKKVQEYWLNETIADIQVSRRVLPDLLSRNWVLKDEASGISRRVSSLPEAIRFLTRLENFPVLDRSLLDAATPYRISIGVAEQEGEISEAWWATLWKPVQFSIEKDFSLP